MHCRQPHSPIYKLVRTICFGRDREYRTLFDKIARKTARQCTHQCACSAFLVVTMHRQQPTHRDSHHFLAHELSRCVKVCVSKIPSFTQGLTSIIVFLIPTTVRYSQSMLVLVLHHAITLISPRPTTLH